VHFVGLFLSSLLKMNGPKNKIVRDKYSDILPTECWVEYLCVQGRKWPENGENCTSCIFI